MSLRQIRHVTRGVLRAQQSNSRQFSAWMRQKYGRRALPVFFGVLLALFVGGLFLLRFATDSRIPESESSQPTASYDVALDVLRVIDGDTFEVFYDGEPTSVRIYGLTLPREGSLAIARLRLRFSNCLKTGRLGLSFRALESVTTLDACWREFISMKRM